MSRKVLTGELRSMAEEGLVARRELDAGALPHVEDSLTAHGASLEPVFDALTARGHGAPRAKGSG